MSPGEVTTESMTIRTPMPQPTPTNASVSNVSYKKPAVTSALAVTFSLLFILTVIVFVCSWLKKNKRKPSRSTSRESNNDLEMNNSRSNDNSLIDSEGTPFIDGSESYSVSCTDTNSRLDSVQYEPNPRPSTPVQESGTLHSGDASPSLTAGTKLTVDMTPNNSVTSHPCTSTSASHCPPAGSRHAERDRSLTSTPLSFASSSQTDSSGHSRAGTSIVCTGEFSEQDPGPPVPLQTPTFDPVAPSSPVDSGKS
ncbi:hypothetical protein EB796_008502 [Bugula neritina]|uniref:Uncharacterized protein n=1 Tax=Bugula neritina TaxID=10212 RepID=A0A7J7K3I4_BUGNE|nr:hypothetical protein EB796_008502 [Bugula neritina]